MSWNYRVIRYEKGGFGLHEVFYDEAGKPNGMTEKPIEFVGDTLDDLTGSLEMALRDARERPVLDERTIVPAEK